MVATASVELVQTADRRSAQFELEPAHLREFDHEQAMVFTRAEVDDRREPVGVPLAVPLVRLGRITHRAGGAWLDPPDLGCARRGRESPQLADVVMPVCPDRTDVATPSDGMSVPAGGIGLPSGPVGGNPDGTGTTRGLMRATVFVYPLGQTRSRSLPAASATSTDPSRSAARPYGLDSSGSPSALYGSGSPCWYWAMSLIFTGDMPGRIRYSVAPPDPGGPPTVNANVTPCTLVSTAGALKPAGTCPILLTPWLWPLATAL